MHGYKWPINSPRTRIGLFDKAASAGNPYSRLDETVVGSAAHQALALEAARQGIVLLKHTAGVLPFKRGGGSPVLIGPTLEVRKGR